jgi:hypothetical protein
MDEPIAKNRNRIKNAALDEKENWRNLLIINLPEIKSKR